MRIKSKR